MKLIRFFSLLMSLLLLILTIVSCAPSDADKVDNNTDNPVTSADPSLGVDTSPEYIRENYPDTLPDNLDFGGETLRLYYRNSENYKLDFVATDISGDSISDAVYKRNQSVEERLKIKLELIAGSSDSKTYCSYIRNSTLSGDNEFDLISAYQAYTIPLSLEGCFHDLVDAPYLDFDMPWWDYEYMAELQVNDDKVFFLQGDIALFMIGSMGSVFFNKAIFTSLYGSADDFYNLIFDGRWTMDLFGEYSAGAYFDSNGNGSADAGDRYGFAATTVKSTEHFMYDAGVVACSRDANGLPTLVLDNEHTIAVIEKMYELYYENVGAFIESADSSINTFENMFIDSRLLFLPGWMYMARKISTSNMTDDYGIIPWPKFNEQQASYRTLVHDGTTIYCISAATVGSRFEMTCAATEAFAAESYRSVVPTYYDIALKYRYTNDAQSAQMVDLIRENITTDFFYANNYSFTGSPGLICRKLMQGKSSNFKSYYKAVSKTAAVELEKIIAQYNSMK